MDTGHGLLGLKAYAKDLCTGDARYLSRISYALAMYSV